MNGIAGNGLSEWIPPCGYCKGRRDAAACWPPRLGAKVFSLAVALVRCVRLRKSQKERVIESVSSPSCRNEQVFLDQTREVMPLGFARELERPNRAFTQTGELVSEPELSRTVDELGPPAIKLRFNP